MTKRDYAMIAACIKSHAAYELECNNSETGVAVMWDFAKHMAAELLNTNPRFDMNMFLDACRVKADVRIIPQRAMRACPHSIMMPGHYRDDNTCRCDDPTHDVMYEWGYHWDGSKWVEPPEDAA